MENDISQECIPIGCAPCTAVAVSWGGGGLSATGGVCLGGFLPRGVSVGGCFPRGVFAWSVSAWGRGCLPREVSVKGSVWPGGICLRGVFPAGCLPRGVSTQGGVCPGWDVCQTVVKTLPCRNYVADGNDTDMLVSVVEFLPFPVSG